MEGKEWVVPIFLFLIECVSKIHLQNKKLSEETRWGEQHSVEQVRLWWKIMLFILTSTIRTHLADTGKYCFWSDKSVKEYMTTSHRISLLFASDISEATVSLNTVSKGGWIWNVGQVKGNVYDRKCTRITSGVSLSVPTPSLLTWGLGQNVALL